MDVYPGLHGAQLVAFCAKAHCGGCSSGAAGVSGVFLLSIISLDRTKDSPSIPFPSIGWQQERGHSQTLPPGMMAHLGCSQEDKKEKGRGLI